MPHARLIESVLSLNFLILCSRDGHSRLKVVILSAATAFSRRSTASKGSSSPHRRFSIDGQIPANWIAFRQVKAKLTFIEREGCVTGISGCCALAILSYESCTVLKRREDNCCRNSWDTLVFRFI